MQKDLSETEMAKAREEIEKLFSKAQDRLVLQASDLSLETIANMVESEAIDLEPQFQRRQRWDKTQQSSLIESFLLNVPVPPVYLAEDDYGNYSVIDGKQRITSIHTFMKNELKLTGLEAFDLIEGFLFEDIPAPLQNALRVRPYLRVITLLRQSDPELKYEVFSRLNKGGEQLEPQEIRNVAYRGDLNDMIYELAENDFLRKQLKIRNEKSPAYQKMADAEMVLRFLMLREEWDNFSGSYRQSMDDFMLEHRNDTTEQLGGYRESFEGSLEACEEIWRHRAFKRPEGGGWRNQMLTGMYDAQMIACARSSDDVILQAIDKSSEVIAMTRSLFEQDEDFEMAVRRATNTPQRVEYRIEKIYELLHSV